MENFIMPPELSEWRCPVSVHQAHVRLHSAQLLAKDRRPQDAKLVHVSSSGLKAAATWHRVEILQVLL